MLDLGRVTLTLMAAATSSLRGGHVYSSEQLKQLL